MVRKFLNVISGRSSAKSEMGGGYQDHLFALIVAGGGGTRLWPKSKNNSPKQFLRLFEKQTLMQITVIRISKLIPWKKIFIVTVSEEYKKEIMAEVPEVPTDNVIVEPLRKNTAAAHALGALYIYKTDPEAVIINAAADHLVKPVSLYKEIMNVAAKAAFEMKSLVAVGVKPTYPNIGYGYIKKGEKIGVLDGHGVYKLGQFTEKPELDVANKYLSSGNYFWNANQYVWRADDFLNSLEKHTPEVGTKMRSLLDYLGTKEEENKILSVYQKLPEISVDYAVSEKEKNFLFLIANYNWSDIGDWKEVWENLPKDAQGNVIIEGGETGGRVINIDTSDALIHTNGRLIAIIDVDNIAVVDTKDVLLICAKSRAQNVKKVVEQLKEEGEKAYL